jgi:hypothetical protein
MTSRIIKSMSIESGKPLSCETGVLEWGIRKG